MSAIPNLSETVKRTADTATISSATHTRLDDTSIDNFRPLRVIVIGAGFSGINCGIRIPQRLKNVDLAIYEKNSDIGGTWFENRYPGCACDVPGPSFLPIHLMARRGRLTERAAHSYQYSYAPNPSWNSFYATGAEIHGYLKGVAEKFSANRFIKCNHAVQSCTWDDNASIW